MKYFYTCLAIGIFLLVTPFAHAQVLVTEDFNDFSGITPWPASGYDGQWISNSIPAFVMEAAQSCGGVSARGTLSTGSIEPELFYLTQESTGEDIVISFDYKLLQNAPGNPATGVTNNFGKFDFQYTINNGSSWTTYYTLDHTNHTPSTSCATLTHTISSTDVPIGSDFGWRVIGDYTGAATGSNNYIYIDNFSAVEQVDCIQPVNIEVGDVTFNSIEVMWDDINTPSATEWNIAFCPSGISPSSPVCANNIVMGITSNPYTITGGVNPLDDGEVYDIYIQTVCGPADESVWSGPTSVQTVAIGTDCANAIEINNDPSIPVAGDLPFTHSSNTAIYDSSYSGSPGINCGAAGNYLDGNDVVYYYVPYDDDILQIELSGNLSGSVGVFVYASCADIGTACIAGATSSSGSFGVNDLFVTGGQDYYIVISTTGAGSSTEYTLDITGFNCATWEAPDGDAIYEFYNQTLGNYDGTGIGVQPTINGAVLTWYEDDNGVPGVEVTNPPSVVLQDNDIFWVKQSIGGCDSPFLMVTFEEFDCLGQLEIVSIDESDSVCDSGTVTLHATGNTTNLYWYDAEVDGEIVGTGNTFTTPTINQTTSYWVSEVFVGEGITEGQASLGPVTSSSYTTNNVGVLFTIAEPITLLSTRVYVTGGSGNMTIELRDVSGTHPTQQVVVGVPGGSAAMPTPVTIPLNFEITTGTYRLLKVSGPSMMGTPAASNTFPYAIGTAGNVTNGSTATGTSTIYYYFYDWSIIEQQPLCESAREEVVATVHQTVPVNITADDTNVCVGHSTWLYANSTDTDYDYTWTWTDASGPNVAVGDQVQVVINADTTFNLTAINPITGCEYNTSIEIAATGAGEVPVNPISAELCTGDIIELTAGGVYHTFNQQVNNWTTTNTSNAPNGDATAAGWKLVNSPYVLADNSTSNDNSQFYISVSDEVGLGGSINTTLVSPSFNLVGVAAAELEFFHFYRHITTNSTTARVQVSVNQGNWVNLSTYTSTQGASNNFSKVNISLNSYLGADDVRIRFEYTGNWGWWWAIDNVSITRSYINGEVTWESDVIGEPYANLFLDPAATVPYNGTSTNVIYFKSENGGVYTYTTILDVIGCGNPLTDQSIITVNETAAPTGSEEFWFSTGQTLANVGIPGAGLRWYRLVNGVPTQISINTPLVNGETYMVTQTQNGCESEPFEFVVYLECPTPTIQSVYAENGGFGTANMIVLWDNPENMNSVIEYYIIITDEDDVIVYEGNHSTDTNFAIIPGLEFDKEFVVTLYAICDPNYPVYGDAVSETFDTFELSTHDNNFNGFAYYPNPTNGRVTFENLKPIEKIEIYSLTGQKITAYNGQANTEVNVDFSNLASGVYMAKVKVEDAVQVVRIIKK